MKELEVDESFEDLNCFQLTWQSNRMNSQLEDCFYISGDKNGVWWGGGELNVGGFPLHKSGKVGTSPLVTGDLDQHNWGHILRHSFISSTGMLISLSPDVTTNVSINVEELDKKESSICFSVSATENINPPVLNYSICTTPNISTLHRFMTSKTKYHKEYISLMNDANKSSKEIEETVQKIKKQVKDRLENPVWTPWYPADLGNLTEDIVWDYVKKVSALTKKINQKGHILLPSQWQTKSGSFMFDTTRFPNINHLTGNITRLGYQLALTITPMVDSDSEIFKTGTADGLWVRQYHSSLPVLTKTNDIVTAAIIDFTNEKSVEWFTHKLNALKNEYKITRFHILPTLAHDLPYFHQFKKHISNPDQTIDIFLSAVTKHSTAISTEVAIDVPSPPTFMTISEEGYDGWTSLRSMVNRTLTLSMLGMPLLDTGFIGGGKCKPGYKPSKELYIRWYQAASYLPAFQMCVLPGEYDKNTKAIILDFATKRKVHVLNKIVPEISNAIKVGKPLITPLSLMFPNDKEAENIVDQWMIGDYLLVAPILNEGERSRDVYLPEGLWKDMLDNHIKGGNSWLRNHKVPLTHIGLFRLLKPEGYTDDINER